VAFLEGERMTALNHIPSGLADVALIDARACAASASISVSSWYDVVRTGNAPQPVIRSPRCTRWRVADVRKWLSELAAQGIDDEVAQAVLARASKAASASRAKRRLARSDGVQS
jgi:predicted DNA-binding transcriptional regulator AlpA